MAGKKVVEMKNVFFHGVGGLEINFVMYPKSALYLSLTKLENILKHKMIYSRENLKKLGIDNPEFPYHLGASDVDMKNNFVSICKKDLHEDSAFEQFVEGKIAIVLNSNIREKIKFRDTMYYIPNRGEEQIENGIDVSNFIAIVNDIEDEQYQKLATKSIVTLLTKYKYQNIPIINMKGELLIDKLTDLDIER